MPFSDSDSAAWETLTELADRDSALALLVREHLIQRLVTTVDNLPRHRIARQALVVQRVPGALAVREDADGGLWLAEENYGRYAPYVDLFGRIDTRRAAAVYARFYPLLQEAYRELGYPEGYFNDRLVEVIDHLLAAPEPEGPVALVRTERGYAFADPALESASVGHKALVRVGPAQATVVKAKLREIRQALARP